MLPLIILYVFYAAVATATCFEPTVAYPPPHYDASHPILRNAFAQIKALLSLAVEASEFDSTSFSVDVTSSKEPLWTFHHTARHRNTSRPGKAQVDGDALYRIASITKVFTVLGILQQHAAGNLSLDDPVDKYIPELHGHQKGSIPWKDIRLRTLASQLSGLPRDFAQSDLINVGNQSPQSPEELGLPHVSRDGLLRCDEYSPNYTMPCGAADLLDTITAREPLFAPNAQSTYSNIAFELLGLVLEKVTNRTYESYIDETIFKPLNMSKSTLSPPPDNSGVIPCGRHYWDMVLGVQNPTGGIYSSSTDLSKLLRYVLTHYNGISSTLNWFQPASSSGGLQNFYGMPWEIFHTDRVLPNSRRPVRFITKSGGLPGYTSLIIVLPEYGLGITLLSAGPREFITKLLEIVNLEVVRAAEALAIVQLQERYAGTFKSPDPELNSSITIIADDRGLVLERFISNSTDFIHSSLPAIYSGLSQRDNWYVQLVPTLLYQDEKEMQGEQWRVSVTNTRVEGDRPVWDDFCSMDIDQVMYAGRPLNEIVFWEGRNGIFDDVGLPAFRVNLSRIVTDAEFGTHDAHGEAQVPLEL